MKISFCVNQSFGFAKAAIQLGHQPSVFVKEKVFDNFSGFKPELVFVDYSDKTLEKAIKKFNPSIIKINPNEMLCDCPPNFPGGIFKEEYACEVVIVGTYKSEYKNYIKILDDYNVKYKIFGYGLWRNPRYLGVIKPEEVSNAYKSAKYSLDLDGDYKSIFSIIKSGGFPITTKKFNSGITALDETRHIDNLPILLEEKPNNINTDIPIIYDFLKEKLCKQSML